MEGDVTIGGITSAMGLLANCLVRLKEVYPKVSVTLVTRARTNWRTGFSPENWMPRS